MARQLITGTNVNLGASSSNLTGPAYYVGDFQQLSVSVQSSTGSASRYTIVGSNDDGFTRALGTPSQTINQNGWSVVTTLVGSGIYSVTAGMKWLLAFRDGISVSASSNVTVTFFGRT